MWLLYHSGSMKKIALIIAVIVVLAAGAVFGALWMGDRKMSRVVGVKVVPVAYAPPDPQVLKLGKYLFESRGCGECHGMDGAGKVVVDDPNGMHVRSPDITPAKSGKVAGYTEADWVRAIRHGIDPAGRALLVMPSEDYNRMNDADFAALVAYIRKLPAGRGTPAEVRFPFIVRVLYGLGMVKDAAERIDHRLPPSTPVAVGATVEHGGYVANMCMGCHGESYSGGKIPGGPPDWPPAARLTPGEGNSMTRYADADAFVRMFKSGKRPDGTPIKVMPFESLGQMNDTDVRALFLYLKSLPPSPKG
jgi:cytochrome c553